MVGIFGDHPMGWGTLRGSDAFSGRVAYLQAEARLGLGERVEAETLYLESYRADPSYFWVVADLAVYYATSDAAADRRRQAAAPYLDRLRGDFDDHPERDRVVAKVERALSRS